MTLPRNDVDLRPLSMNRSLRVKMNFRRAAAVASFAILMASVGVLAVAQQRNPFNDSADGNMEVVPLRDNIYLIGGAGSNIVISAGPEGVLMVDSGLAENADKVLQAVQ